MARFGRAYPMQRVWTGPVLAPVFDSNAVSTYQSSTASGTAFTWNQTTTAGAYGIVALVANSATTFTFAATPSVKIGTTTLSSLGNVAINNSLTNGFVWVFGGNTVPGGSQTVSVTLTQSGRNYTGWGASFTYKNVISVGTLQTAFNTSASPSVSVSSSSANAVWGLLAAAANVTFSSFSVTQRAVELGPAVEPDWIAGDTPGVGSVTVSASITANSWGAVGLNLL